MRHDVRAVNVMAGDAIMVDGRAALVIEAKHRWRYGVQHCRITYRDVYDVLRTVEAHPETRYDIIRLHES